MDVNRSPAAPVSGATTHITETIAVAADAGRVWSVVGDAATISAWLPAIATSSVEGQQRFCTTADGADLRECILERSDDERFYVYEILDSPMPVQSYRSRLSVDGHGDHSHVTWTADFEPSEGADAAEVEAMFSTIYREGLENVRARVQDEGD